MLGEKTRVSGSFRDPAGFLFWHNDTLFRQINSRYRPTYQKLIENGLYDKLIKAQWLIPHQELPSRLEDQENTLIIQPQQIPMISYPYEWSFAQLKDAALLTLNIQQMALEHGMILKDASAYNIQFIGGKPIFIDTLSFEEQVDGMPWVAYKQFCQHFMAPLLLMKYCDRRLNQLLKIYIDGIPLDLASQLLPFRSKFNLTCAIHIHAHAKLQNKYQHETAVKRSHNRFTIKTLKLLNQSLLNTIQKIRCKNAIQTEWEDYYSNNNNYTPEAFTEKEAIIDAWLEPIKPRQLWDLGANTGRFSQIASAHAKYVVAWDIDANCVEAHYQHNHQHASKTILPLILDLTNPSPAIGWEHQERLSFIERGPVDAVLALGLIHHLAIVNNLPLSKIAHFFSKICDHLILEFIPKSDSQVIKLLSTREDIFPDYTLEDMLTCFDTYFTLTKAHHFKNSERSLLLFKIKRVTP